MLDFEQFCALHREDLTKYARVLTKDRDSAQDLIGDSLLYAFKHWRRIGPMDYPLAYVRRIVTSTFLGSRRRWAHRHIHPSDPAGMASRTKDDTVRVDDRDQLARALLQLTPRQRAAIVLRYYLDLDDHEIAGQLGLATGSARSLLSRGLALLRSRLAATDLEVTRERITDVD